MEYFNDVLNPNAFSADLSYINTLEGDEFSLAVIRFKNN